MVSGWETQQFTERGKRVLVLSADGVKLSERDMVRLIATLSGELDSRQRARERRKEI